jgi:hypothetical protein
MGGHWEAGVPLWQVSLHCQATVQVSAEGEHEVFDRYTLLYTIVSTSLHKHGLERVRSEEAQ